MANTKSKAELRKFGFVMTGALGVFGGLGMWREKDFGPWLISIAIAFALLALLAPRALAPVEKAWMAFAHVIGTVMTYVILTVAFILVFTPMGLFLRLLGKDLLERKIDPDAPSYWTPVDPDGSANRPEAPY